MFLPPGRRRHGGGLKIFEILDVTSANDDACIAVFFQKGSGFFVFGLPRIFGRWLTWIDQPHTTPAGRTCTTSCMPPHQTHSVNRSRLRFGAWGKL